MEGGEGLVRGRLTASPSPEPSGPIPQRGTKVALTYSPMHPTGGSPISSRRITRNALAIALTLIPATLHAQTVNLRAGGSLANLAFSERTLDQKSLTAFTGGLSIDIPAGPVAVRVGGRQGLGGGCRHVQRRRNRDRRA